MGLLTRFFSAPEALAQELANDAAGIARAWQQYRASLKEKGGLIDALQPGDAQAVGRLRQVLSSELVTLSVDEKTEQEFLTELAAFEQAKDIKRIQKLEDCLAYIETRHRYVHGLLTELSVVLQRELGIAEMLSSGRKDAALVAKLKESWQVEQAVLAKIGDIQTFEQLFQDLLTGREVVRQLTARERSLMPRLSKMGSAGLVRAWVGAVLDGIQAKVDEGVATGMLATGHHYNIDFEFVNRPEFVGLVREALKSVRSPGKHDASETTINTFVHIFREWFNTRE